MELILVRHAEPATIESGLGPANPGLTTRGVAQSNTLAQHLAAEGIAAIYRSPSRRTAGTAEPIAQRIGLDPTVDDRLGEFNLGSIDYLPVAELKRRNDPRWHALREGRIYDSPLGADGFRAQVLAVLDSIVARHPGEKVLVVTHAGVINVITGSIIGMTRLIWTAPDLASISRIRVSRRGDRSLVSLNETGHLGSMQGAVEVSR